VTYAKELLNPEAWGEVLELFARSIDLAVALLDDEGRLVGKCHNPQPIWKLARKSRPNGSGGCLFCLEATQVCTAAADAVLSRAQVIVRDQGGCAHVATPIYLDGRHVGTLLAGQVFDQYPELLLMEQLAKTFGLSGQRLWHLARKRIPMSRVTLASYGNLLGTLGNAFLREQHAVILQRELQSSNRDLKNKVVELDQSLAEKDVLLNEVHHRVNNNLQVIASLLRMQAEDFPDLKVADALRESQLRVESMALIHAHLYNATDWSALDFAKYTGVLAETLFLSYGVDQSRISCRVEIVPFDLGVDKAIPAGLILNELISNALKHAFPEGSGSILITGGLSDGRIDLAVQDDGPGVPPTVEPHRRQSLGLKIVNILSRQLKGTFVPPQPGAPSIFRISFPTAARAASTAI
jgi:two-component sensor histidine kinase/ligand-binding sensor protein